MYKNVVKQMGTIFQLGSAFTSSLVKTIKKDKFWALASWSESEIDQLLTLLLYHVRANRVERNHQKGLSRQSTSTGVLRFTVFFEVNKSRKKLSDNGLTSLPIVFCTRKPIFL